MNYADFLKRESAMWALLELLQALKIVKPRRNRFGTTRYFSDQDIQNYIKRLVESACD